MQEKRQKELLFSVNKKDFDIDYFSGKGAGGQYRNRHKNCVRLKHKESGAYSTGQSNRDRKSNIREAINTLVSSSDFKLWINRRVHEVIEGKKIEEKVEEQMRPENLKFEVREKSGWTEYGL